MDFGRSSVDKLVDTRSSLAAVDKPCFIVVCFFQTTNVVVTPASANENTIGYVILYISLLAGKVKPLWSSII
jgi:hypothetical protein